MSMREKKMAPNLNCDVRKLLFSTLAVQKSRVYSTYICSWNTYYYYKWCNYIYFLGIYLKEFGNIGGDWKIYELSHNPPPPPFGKIYACAPEPCYQNLYFPFTVNHLIINFTSVGSACLGNHSFQIM